MELLSPAGDLETAVAAFQYGADAVYLGMKQFSARADANNFTCEELAVLMGLAHGDSAHPRRVYVAINTLIREAELPQLLPLLAQLEALRVDAIILQDIAVAGLIKRYFPGLTIHASTQMAIHTVEGMIACREAGFSRVIAARELTIAEIGELAKVPGIELEIFGHGALCYAYSGLCLLSSVLNGPSGNRGECSYVCRNCWNIGDKNGRTIAQPCHLMSMKDLSLGDYCSTLKKLGVASLKIEGRKKTPLYVAAVTNYFRKLIDGTFLPGEREASERDVRAIFSRNWTRFHLPGERTTGVTDTAVTGPRGTQVGYVTAVSQGVEYDSIRFRVENMTLEKHDGLQVELPGRSRPYGFGIENIRAFQQGGADRWDNVFTAPPTTVIEVPLPADHPAIPVGAALYCTSSQEVKRRYRWPSVRSALVRQRTAVDFLVTVSPAALEVKATLGHTTVFTEMECSPQLTPARKSPEALAEDARRAFAKLGDTPYDLGEFIVDNPDNLFVPMSTLNELRRMAVAAIEETTVEQRNKTLLEVSKRVADWRPQAAVTAGAAAPAGGPRWIICTDRHSSLNLFTAEELAEIHEVVFDLSRTPAGELKAAVEYLSGKVGGEKIRLGLPSILRGDSTHNWKNIVAEFAHWPRWQVANPAALALLAEAGITAAKASITANWQLYVTNSAAAKELLDGGYQRVCLSPDDTLENTLLLANKLSPVAEVLVYQDTPLAISAVCANASLMGACPGRKECTFTSMQLSNRKGDQLLAINHHCQTVYIRRQPLDRTALLPRLRESGAQFLRADFIWREWTPAAVHQQWQKLRTASAK